jgi:hypothetical protein
VPIVWVVAERQMSAVPLNRTERHIDHREIKQGLLDGRYFQRRNDVNIGSEGETLQTGTLARQPSVRLNRDNCISIRL